MKKGGNSFFYMIYAYTGKTGSGKTFHMVADAFKMWLDGSDIYSNTILKFEDVDQRRLLSRIRQILKLKPRPRGRIIYFEDISEILEAKTGVILFDEAQVLFNARNWESLPDEFQYKLQQHRKHRLDLLCTTQNMGTIDIAYRRLVQVWFHHHEIFKIGTHTTYLGFYRRELKDVDELYNTIDDLKATTLKDRIFVIHYFRRRLYDTFFDIGFKRFKTIWKIHRDQTGFVHRAYIIPKNQKFENALKLISSFKFGSSPSKSSRSKTT